MEIRTITPAYAVSPQITPEDVPALAEAGYKVIICNRPDSEVGPDENAAAVRAAAEAAGLAFHDNPVVNGALTEDNVTTQGKVLSEAGGPVFAYCRSGTRCTIVWALSQAEHASPDDLIETAGRAGYDIAGLRPQLEMMGKRGITRT
ncbi:TIGR01244 family sulfur transferase [Tranquillimonas rosea]|uniref:TIGR01244 family sulfur transferase n=1 Tax=Tranquillimonas rosea TaxID=641238 RepID=UPI003BAD7DFD